VRGDVWESAVAFRAAHRDAVLVAIQVGILQVNLLLTPELLAPNG
jgi:hypothetical protein